MDVPRGKITALIGPSGCGKSTLLRCINRLNDLVDGVRVEGDMLLDGESIYAPGVDVIELRKRTGMVFQKTNPFPMSIYENVVYPLRIDGENRRSVLDETVERALRGAALWDEVKDRLKGSALQLSGGQQQRLCIARAIAAEPEVLLMDEPCSALDPIATARIEELMHELRGDLHHRHRDPQHAAGRARQRLHRLHVPRQAGRVRRRPRRSSPTRAEADRGLRHRPVRLRAAESGRQRGIRSSTTLRSPTRR